MTTPYEPTELMMLRARASVARRDGAARHADLHTVEAAHREGSYA